ncbi:MAG: hypothetical protein ACPL3C_06270, partial [Pyrobaculum sp.]
MSVVREPVFVSVLDPADVSLFSGFRDVSVSVANVTGPYSFLQSVLGARLLGARVDVVVGYWGATFADLADNGYLIPLNLTGGVVYRGRVVGVPVDYGVPLVICRGAPPPRSVHELLNLSRSGGLAVVADPVVLSSVVYSLGGSYFNGSPRALLSRDTVRGFEAVELLLRNDPGNPFNYTRQRYLFNNGSVRCLLDLWWVSKPLPSGYTVS